MTDHPSTFDAADSNSGPVEWDDHASVHLKHDSQGLFFGLKTVHSGTLAEMVGMVSRMPEDERENYVIQKAGDHRLEIDEIMALAAREDFPG